MEFTVKGVKIRFSFLFFFFFTLMFLLDQSGFVLMGFLAALIHEMGHIIAFVLVGDLPNEIAFEISGIKMVRAQKIVSYQKEVFQLLMGSVFNFILFFTFSFCLNSVNQLSIFAVSHLILGIFNLLPIQALDGGKLLTILLSRIFDLHTADRLASFMSWITLSFLFLFSFFFLLFQRMENYSLILLCIWMFVVGIKPKTA